MMNQAQLSRLAAAAHALRPDWAQSSIYTYLARNHSHRAYRDVATALAWIAADEETKTPARLAEMGPWWKAANSGEDTPSRFPSAPRCTTCQSRHDPDEGCGKPVDQRTPEEQAAVDAAVAAAKKATAQARGGAK